MKQPPWQTVQIMEKVTTMRSYASDAALSSCQKQKNIQRCALEAIEMIVVNMHHFINQSE